MVFVSVFALILTMSLSAAAVAEEVKVGALNDMTGATSDVGKDYALGIAEAIHYVNANGGINGKQIKLTQFDYGYRVPEALTKYKLFKRLGCVAVLGWGTGDTEALSPTVTKDKMPYVWLPTPVIWPIRRKPLTIFLLQPIIPPMPGRP